MYVYTQPGIRLANIDSARLALIRWGCKSGRVSLGMWVEWSAKLEAKHVFFSRALCGVRALVFFFRRKSEAPLEVMKLFSRVEVCERWCSVFQSSGI